MSFPFCTKFFLLNFAAQKVTIMRKNKSLIVILERRIMCKRILLGVVVLLSLVSCGESNNDEDVYANWKERNDNYFLQMYMKADSASHAGNPDWKIIRKWSLLEQFNTRKEDHIVAHLLESHPDAKSPIYTDSVVVDIQGRLIPTTYDEKGYVFYSTFAADDRNLDSDLFATISAKGTLMKREVDGLSTALQQMHVGDRWLIYVPYNLALRQQKLDSPFIPAYSTLVFDVTLVRIKQ